jgi:hypothetical protein
MVKLVTFEETSSLGFGKIVLDEPVSGNGVNEDGATETLKIKEYFKYE